MLFLSVANTAVEELEDVNSRSQSRNTAHSQRGDGTHLPQLVRPSPIRPTDVNDIYAGGDSLGEAVGAVRVVSRPQMDTLDVTPQRTLGYVALPL